MLQAVSEGGKPRKIANLTKLAAKGEDKNLIQQIWDKAAGFVGFVGALFRGIAFSATAIWGWLIQRIEQLKAFDWNASDESLKQMIENQNLALASLWGGVIGQGFGWFAGIAVGYGVAFLCPVIGGASLARLIATETGKEALEELLPSLKNALASTAGAIANAGLISLFMNYRRLLKNAPTGLLEAVYGKDGASFIKNVWGNKGGPDMSFNTQMDEFVESIDNKALQAFLENFFEESWDSFMEAGFIVAREIDEAYAQSRQAQKGALGPERTIEITPDKKAKDEKITLIKMPQQLALPAIQQTLVQHRLLYNRDVGAIVGQPEQEWARARPQLRQLTIVFRSQETPPWRSKDGKPARQATYSIPDVRKGLSWQEIKRAANPFTWGRFRATAQLDNQRQMACYGSNETEAKRKLKELLQLSTAEILTLSTTQEEDRPTKLKKDPIRMYPAYATLLARKNSISGGRVDISGAVTEEDIVRIPLWPDEEPPGLPPLG